MLVKRFAFRDSLDENICTLHAEMKKPGSTYAVTDSNLPARAVQVLDHGLPKAVAAPKGKGKAKAK